MTVAKSYQECSAAKILVGIIYITMPEMRVIIPNEVFAILEWEEDQLPAVCVVNQSLANFSPKIVFAWHLSIIVEFADLVGNGMPSIEEKSVVDQIGKVFDVNLKAGGNALLLARITWNGTRQTLYRVCDPELANAFLMGIIDNETQVRPFEFKMEHDPDWELANHFLKQWAT